MKLMHYDPTGEFISLREAMDRLFEDSFIRPLNGAGTFPVDLKETPDAYVAKAALPGIKPEDLKIEATGESVTVSGELKEETTVKDERFLRKERRYGVFQRTLSLPLTIDPNRVEATFAHGIVTLTLPKSEVVKPKQIKVKTAA